VPFSLLSDHELEVDPQRTFPARTGLGKTSVGVRSEVLPIPSSLDLLIAPSVRIEAISPAVVTFSEGIEHEILVRTIGEVYSIVSYACMLTSEAGEKV